MPEFDPAPADDDRGATVTVPTRVFGSCHYLDLPGFGVVEVDVRCCPAGLVTAETFPRRDGWNVVGPLESSGFVHAVRLLG